MTTCYIATLPISHARRVYPPGTPIHVDEPIPDWCALACAIRSGVAVQQIAAPARLPKPARR